MSDEIDRAVLKSTADVECDLLLQDVSFKT